jgi:putative DNA primase/helicase
MNGKRFIKAIEVKENISLNEERIKSLTGEDRTATRYMYKDWFDFMPIGKIWWAVNHKPIIQGTDEAIWRRIQLIPFEVNFPKVPKGKRDPDLKDKLRKELSGILAWAVKGCLEWQMKGLDPPQVVKHATSDYRKQSDIINRFLEECIIRKEGAKVKAGDLYGAYKQWCSENGERELNSTNFGKKLVEKGLKKDTKGWVFYYGLELRTDPDRSS